MDYKEIALQITLKAMDMGYIVQKDWKTIESEDPIKAATEYAAKQISDFYQIVYSRLGGI